MHRTNRPRQRQLTEKFHVFQRHGRQLPTGRQDPQRDGHIKTPAVLGQVGGREIYRRLVWYGREEFCWPYGRLIAFANRSEIQNPAKRTKIRQ